MAPPPRKRPRLHFVCSVSPPPDSDVYAARRSNDLLLKTRWESVFEKYERDFEGIGDEIGFISDEIVVNNGHLRSMQNEGDTGVNHKQVKGSDSGGKRLLRAMTTGPSECASSISEVEQVQEVQDVIQSIETITTHMFADEDSSDDDLFRPSARLTSEEMFTIKEEDVSDTDALFNSKLANRSTSVDSLFDPAPNHDLITQGRLGIFMSHTHNEDIPDAYSIPKEKDVLEEQRLLIRQEVMNVLNEQKEEEEAKIEPAWQIPIHQSSRPLIRKPSLPRLRSNGSSDSRTSQRSSQRNRNLDTDEDENHGEVSMTGLPDQEQLGSIWRPTRRKRRSKKTVVAEKNLRIVRAESEDPLQGDFPSDREESIQQATINRPILQDPTGQYSGQGVSRSAQSSMELEFSEADSIHNEDDVCSDGSGSETSNSDVEDSEASSCLAPRSLLPSTTPDPLPSMPSEKSAISSVPSTMSGRNLEDADEWEVERIADSRLQGQKRKLLHYRVIWKGYAPTWSPWKEVLPGCDRLVQRFHLQFPHKPGPPKGYCFETVSESSADADDPS